MHEPLQNLYTSSKLLILDFNQIPARSPDDENIQHFFHDCEANDIDPKLPINRQRFNDQLLAKWNVRYLISRYGEDRRAMLAGSRIAKEGRTIHLGVDIFCRDLETVYAPCDGEIVRSGQEPQSHSFGYYLILKPANPELPCFFMGHLSSAITKAKTVKAGEPIAHLGDFHHDENGGWSRHLHLQTIRELPSEGTVPLGYSSNGRFDERDRNSYPDPVPYFPELII